MSIGMVEKQSFEALKGIAKNSRDLEEMIKQTGEFQVATDKAMEERNADKSTRKTEQTPLFSAATVEKYRNTGNDQYER